MATAAGKESLDERAEADRSGSVHYRGDRGNTYTMVLHAYTVGLF